MVGMPSHSPRVAKGPLMVGAGQFLNLDDERFTNWLVPSFIKNLGECTW